MLYVDIEKNFSDFSLATKLESTNEVVALLGGSGCGKSLTLKCIAGIETPDRGKIIINGETMFDSEKRINLPPQKRRVGFLFQNYALFPNMSVRRNIESVIEKTKQERREISAAIIESFQLNGLENLYPHQISGGQQQRVALARILVRQPNVLLLDEPFSALDSHLKWTVEQQIASLLANFSGTTVFVSHDRDEVYRISQKIAVMVNGKVETFDTKEKIFANPKTRASAVLTGCKNIAGAKKTAEYELEVPAWGVRFRTETPLDDNLCAVGLRSYHFNERVRCNRYPMVITGMTEELFAHIFSFRYENQDPAAPDITWRVMRESKCAKDGEMPAELGIRPKNILPLYV